MLFQSFSATNISRAEAGGFAAPQSALAKM
jgi:hypothetical protein